MNQSFFSIIVVFAWPKTELTYIASQVTLTIAYIFSFSLPSFPHSSSIEKNILNRKRSFSFARKMSRSISCYFIFDVGEINRSNPSIPTVYHRFGFSLCEMIYQRRKYQTRVLSINSVSRSSQFVIRLLLM